MVQSPGEGLEKQCPSPKRAAARKGRAAEEASALLRNNSLYYLLRPVDLRYHYLKNRLLSEAFYLILIP